MQPITFPGLGLKFIINPIAIQLFGISIHWYGIIIGIGCALALYLANKDAKRFNVNNDDITDFILFALPLSIIGARIYYVVFSWNDYKNNILEVFQIWHGGIAIYGGVLTAVIVALVFTKNRKLSRLDFFDFLIPYLALGQSIGRWGNFVNQEAHGVLTNLPWRMEIFDAIGGQRITVHPTFLYESLWTFGLFLFLIWFREKKKIKGEVFTLYLTFYGLGRFFIEGLRTDSLYWGSMRVSQGLAGLFFVVSITIFIVNRVRISKISNSTI